MSQVPYDLDLRDLMDTVYGVGAWKNWTGDGTGDDAGPALHLGIKTIQGFQNGGGKIEVGPFNWRVLKSPVDIDGTTFAGVVLEGVASPRSCFIYENSANGIFYKNDQSGGGMNHVAILLGAASQIGSVNTGSIAIDLEGNAVTQADQSTYSDLYVSSVGGSSFWGIALNANGTARVPPAAIGDRVTTFDNIQLFNVNGAGAYLNGCEQFTLNNFGIYTSHGANANALVITGTPTVPSNHIYGQGVNCAGGIFVNNAADVMINGTRYA